MCFFNNCVTYFLYSVFLLSPLEADLRFAHVDKKRVSTIIRNVLTLGGIDLRLLFSIQFKNKVFRRRCLCKETLTPLPGLI